MFSKSWSGLFCAACFQSRKMSAGFLQRTIGPSRRNLVDCNLKVMNFSRSHSSVISTGIRHTLLGLPSSWWSYRSVKGARTRRAYWSRFCDRWVPQAAYGIVLKNGLEYLESFGGSLTLLQSSRSVWRAVRCYRCL